MLVLTRQVEQEICIGAEIRVRVLSVHGGQVRLGIEAPAEVPIHRGELLSAVREANEAAGRAVPEALGALRQAARLAAQSLPAKADDGTADMPPECCASELQVLPTSADK